jgi:hypothetical protein
MDYQSAVESVYAHLEAGHADKAVMVCLRIARNSRDYLNAATFLRELYPSKNEFGRVLADDTSHLKEDAVKFLWERSLDRWMERHTLDFDFTRSRKDGEKKLLAVSVGELDTEIQQWEHAIDDLAVPSGMTPYDTAFFTDKYNQQKGPIRMRINALHMIKQRIQAYCLNYAITVERQIAAQNQTQSFLHRIQNEVNNYFKARSEDVYAKLLKAAQLVDSEEQEDCSLLLTQVRRAIKASADYFYPPSSGHVVCSDGKERALGEDQYLNRLTEYLASNFRASTAKELLSAELEYLLVFARRLNNVASKGVHSEVTAPEAKQGLLGLYMFLYNVISRTQVKALDPASELDLQPDVS